MRVLAVALALVIFLPVWAQDQIDYDQDTTVLAFKEMVFPPPARGTHMQGVVTIRVQFDDQGKVISASAISGPRALIPLTVANVKEWRFKPNASKTAVIVYKFTIIEGECASLDHMFVFQPPNLANVIACPIPLNP